MTIDKSRGLRTLETPPRTEVPVPRTNRKPYSPPQIFRLQQGNDTEGKSKSNSAETHYYSVNFGPS